MTRSTTRSGGVADALTELKAISSEMDADIRVRGCDGACVNPGDTPGYAVADPRGGRWGL